MWFTFRLYGLSGLQDHIRQQVLAAKQFEKLLLQDYRFELVSPTYMGLVCFKLKGPSKLTCQLFNKITEQQNIYLVPASFRGNFFIHFAICTDMTREDITFSLNEIQKAADSVIGDNDDNKQMLMETTQGIMETFTRLKVQENFA